MKASCDRHLLAAAHDSIDVGAVLAVLKAMLALGRNSNLSYRTPKLPFKLICEDKQKFKRKIVINFFPICLTFYPIDYF